MKWLYNCFRRDSFVVITVKNFLTTYYFCRNRKHCRNNFEDAYRVDSFCRIKSRVSSWPTRLTWERTSFSRAVGRFFKQTYYCITLLGSFCKDSIFNCIFIYITKLLLSLYSLFAIIFLVIFNVHRHPFLLLKNQSAC